MDRGNVVRAVLAVGVIALVVVMVVLDRNGGVPLAVDDDSTPSPESAGPAAGAPQRPPAGEVVPLPEAGSPTPKDEIPTPPPGIEAIACEKLQRTVDLTVVSFNTHRSYGPDGMARIAAEIGRAQADVVMLQEIDRFWARTRYVDQPAWFARRLGMEYVFGANVVSGRRQYGTVILSRFPVLDQQSIRLPNAPGGEQRGLLRATVRVGGREVSVYNTHLQPGMRDLRARQADVVSAAVSGDPRPVILGGDFNSGPGTPTLRRLRRGLYDTWAQAGTGSGATHHSGARIDYLLASEDLTPTGSRVHPSGVSDHHLVRATYTLAPSAECPDTSGS